MTLWVVTVFSFMWMSVDRYLAVRKPLRYDTVQTKTRCQCWMVFTWISSLMLCCPPLLGFYKPLYNKEAHICMLDWGNMAAYTITLGILVSFLLRSEGGQKKTNKSHFFFYFYFADHFRHAQRSTQINFYFSVNSLLIVHVSRYWYRV